MNKEENKISLRSEEVQEIMGEVPAKIVRWGTTIIFIIIIILIAGSYLFKYPEVINSDIEITINNETITRVGLSSLGAGRVMVGQKVQIRLNSYPEHEFGYLEGVISSISFKELKNGKYIAGINFPKKVKTNYGFNLTSDGVFEGKATIITKDKRLLERIINTINRYKN